MNIFFYVKPLLISAAALLFLSCNRTGDIPQDIYSETDTLIEEALRNDLFTGAVLLIGDSNEINYHKAYGFATLYDENLRVVTEPDSMTTAHLFDLASLTKIFAATYGLMALHTDGLVNVDDLITEYLPDFDTEHHKEITIRHLLTHSSGLLQWYPSYYVAEDREARRKFIAGQPLQNRPGEVRRYSDLGFMLLGDIIEQVSGMPMPEYLENRIYSKLALSSTRFNPGSGLTHKMVSTSHGNPFEKKMVHEPDFGYNIDIDPDSWNNWRKYTLQGEVNDGNAYYTHGGVAGHAGLFSTAEELYILLGVILHDGYFRDEKIFGSDTIQLFTTKDRFRNGLGWGMEPAVLHAADLPDGSVGHTGFTGTNFVMSIKDGKVFILLTNRQHVGVDERGNYPNLRELREKLAEFIF